MKEQQLIQYALEEGFSVAAVVSTQEIIFDPSFYTDIQAIIAAKKSHNNAEIALAKRLRAEDCAAFTVGASGCALCSPCKIQTGEPRKFPEDRYFCISAYCIFVKDLAEKCGMDYSWKEEELSFYGMYVFD